MDCFTLFFDLDSLRQLCRGEDVIFYAEDGEGVPIVIEFDPQVTAVVRRAIEMAMLHTLPTAPGVH